MRDLFTATNGQLALYRLFGGGDQGLARLAVILGALMVAPIYFLHTIHDAAALPLARGADFLSGVDKPRRDALVMMFLRMHGHGILASEIFWGLWLFPSASVTGILWPQYEQRVSNRVFPVMLGEVATMLWFIITGAKEQQPLATAA